MRDWFADGNGSPLDPYRWARQLKPGEDAKAVACTLTRQRLSKKSTGFNRPLQYASLVY